ncbi:MAG: inorganic phosphate transporter [Chlamydiales bacterium]
MTDFTFYLLIGTIVIALAFDLMNGFHDAANAIATVVSTRVLTPTIAVFWAAFFNFVAIFVFAPKVADTISKIVKIEAEDPTYIIVVCCGLLGAILWDLLTWWWKLPTSSSHALIGGLSGAGLAHGGLEALRMDVLITTAEFIVLAPLLGFTLGFCMIIALYWLCRNWTATSVNQHFRKGQLLSAALYSMGHGANDAQKTMGVIMALLLAGGVIEHNTPLSLLNSDTRWIILSCQLAMSLGTAFGGWRIVKTMGMKIIKLKPIGGFCAETSGAMTLFVATHAGIPVSTTHTIIGSILGIGTAISRPSRIKWSIAAKIVWAWIFTIPAAGLISTACLYLSQFVLS